MADNKTKLYCPNCGKKSKVESTDTSKVCVKCGYVHSTNGTAASFADKFTVKGNK